MHTKERGQRVLAAAVRIGRFLWRQKQVAIALLVIAPLLTGMGFELFALNAVGLGIGALFFRSRVRRRRQEREHGLWLERRAQREEWEHERWLKRREQEADQTAG